MSSKFIYRFQIVFVVLLMSMSVTSAYAQTLESTWNSASGGNYCDINRWDPLRGMPPCNFDTVIFNVTIPNGSGTVFMNCNDCEVGSFSLGVGRTFQIPNGNNYSVTGPAALNGYIHGNGGNFFAPNATFPAKKAHIRADEGAKIEIGVDSYSINGLTGSTGLLVSNHSGTLLDLSQVQNIDVEVANGVYSKHQNIVAQWGGTLDLSGVKSLTTPTNSTNKINMYARYLGNLDLSGLETINSHGKGPAHFIVDDNFLDLSSLKNINTPCYFKLNDAEVKMTGLGAFSEAGMYEYPSGSDTLNVSASTTFDLNNGSTLLLPGIDLAPGNKEILFSLNGANTLIFNGPVHFDQKFAFECVFDFQDFEDGLLTGWTPGGRQEGINEWGVVDNRGSKMGKLYHRQITELTLTKTFDYEPGMLLEWDAEFAINGNHSPRPSGSSNEYSRVVYAIEVRNSSGGKLLEKKWAAATSYFTYSYGYDPFYPTGLQHYAYDIDQMILQASADPSQAYSVKLRFEGYSTWTRYENTEVWFDNVTSKLKPPALNKPTFEFTGDFTFDYTNEEEFHLGRSFVELYGSRLQQVELGGIDFGLITDLIPNNNFGIGQIMVGRHSHPSTVQLVDNYDNGNRGIGFGYDEALYLWGVDGQDGLRLLNGSILFLNNLNAYTLDNGVLISLTDQFPPGQDWMIYDDGWVFRGACSDYVDDAINLITNGGFENGITPPLATDLFRTLPLGSNAITDWTVTSDAVDWVNESHFTDPNTHIGNQRVVDLSGDVAGNGGVSQTITTKPGYRYFVCFDLGANPYGNLLTDPNMYGEKLVEVKAADDSAVFSFDVTEGIGAGPEPAENDPWQVNWKRHSFFFDANDITATLEFTSLDDPATPYGAAIDNVVVLETGFKPWAGDLDRNNQVNMFDLYWFCSHYLDIGCNLDNQCCDEADVNEDGVVNLVDYAMLSYNWMKDR